MSQMRKTIIYFLTLSFILAVCQHCSGDKGTEPKPSTTEESGIAGKVILTGNWPDTPEEVRLITAQTFPPDIDDIVMGESIPLNTDTYDYRFDLDPATYSMVGVAWRPEGTDWSLLSICGLYFSEGDSLAPGQVVIKDSNTVIKNINIDVDRSKVRKITDTKIIGSITFQGTWPADIVEARVIASTKFNLAPLEVPTFLDLGFSDAIPPGTTQIDYVVQAFPATFAATGILFFREGEKLTVEDIIYSSSVGGLNLESYEVREDSTFNGPDFDITF